MFVDIFMLKNVWENNFVLGPFSTESLKKAGFECPKLSFALRNPLQIAKYAQEVVQDRDKNLLHSGLKSPIDVCKSTVNIPDGQLIKIEISNLPCYYALIAALDRLPDQTFALIFIDDTQMDKSICTLASLKSKCVFFSNE